jgi:hypothetical protein
MLSLDLILCFAVGEHYLTGERRKIAKPDKVIVLRRKK